MARPRRIVLVRYGESLGNADDTVYEREPDHALALTETGRRQAEETGGRLRELFGRERVSVYVSPYRRTRETLRAFWGSPASTGSTGRSTAGVIRSRTGSPDNVAAR